MALVTTGIGTAKLVVTVRDACEPGMFVFWMMVDGDSMILLGRRPSSVLTSSAPFVFVLPFACSNCFASNEIKVAVVNVFRLIDSSLFVTGTGCNKIL